MINIVSDVEDMKYMFERSYYSKKRRNCYMEKVGFKERLEIYVISQQLNFTNIV